MKRLIFSIFAVMTAMSLWSGPITLLGSDKKVLVEKPEASTGLNELFVIYNTNGVSIQYNALTNTAVTWYKFKNLGGGYAEIVSGITANGKTYTLPKVESDMGYIVEEGSNRYYFWVVDYSRHYLDLDALKIAPEQDCNRVALNPIGRGEAIKYYTINGQAKELDREITLSYLTLVYDEDSNTYNQTEAVKTYSSLSETIMAIAPLCNTEFCLTGDRFLSAWGESMSVTSSFYETKSIDAHTTATQTERDVDNEKKEETALGGSAPIEIQFEASVSDAVVFTEWQFAQDADFVNITLRISDPITTHTFREHGTTYVRFVASNYAGSCEYYSETYEVFIGESSIDCPNAFSPNASEGTNDEWKVSYKSIVKFECHIFNRWGIEVAEFNDPSQGWDGKHGGKYVPAGVYYYVIKAEGADGRKYNLKGDINIIKQNYKGVGSSTETE